MFELEREALAIDVVDQDLCESERYGQVVCIELIPIDVGRLKPPYERVRYLLEIVRGADRAEVIREIHPTDESQYGAPFHRRAIQRHNPDENSVAGHRE